jgi:hypothetical protein
MKKDLFSEIWKIKEIAKSRVRMMTRQSITPLTLFINLCCTSAEAAAAGSIDESPSQVPSRCQETPRSSPGGGMHHLWRPVPSKTGEVAPRG